MLHLLPRETFAEAETATPSVRQAETAADESSDFEIVLGRRQVASVLFLAIVMASIFSGVSYLAGKATRLPSIAAPSPAPVTRVPETTHAPLITLEPPAQIEAPLFSEQVSGAVYLQMGAVEKGIATIFAEGLRKRGFDAFVASGPNEKIFRVLIGPLPDAQAFVRARDMLDQIGLSTFARKVQQ